MSAADRENDILNAALVTGSTPEREAYLQQACGGDAALLARVQARVSSEEMATESVREATLLPASDEMGAASGTVIGRYRLLAPIGEGGFGVVYLADQLEPMRRRVALKIIKPGMDSRQVIARFEAERQALALMDHPNIARVLDAGTTTATESSRAPGGGCVGRPYFVMEWVRGVPITRYCDEQRLDTKARLRLFMEVCSAVQHAHQKGIIHRDLKPSNILVTRIGDRLVPKVIDFGIAKATQQPLTDKTVFTQFQQILGTPVYMSPEQAWGSGEDVDTRSDIYSLGVLLYELLTGRPPFDSQQLLRAGLEGVRRIIREEQPPKPSTRIGTLGEVELAALARQRRAEPRRLRTEFRGDLDWVVMKTLEKDRERRYETANGLALDIGRYLTGEPVSAGPPAVGYRLRKFLGRHRAEVLAAAAVLTALLVVTVVSLRSAVVQARSRDLAERQRRVIEAVNGFFTDEILAAAEPQVAQGRNLTVREVLDLAAARVPGQFAEDPLIEAAVRLAVGRAYRRLGEWDKARSHIERAQAICQAQLPPEADLRYDATTALARLEQQAGHWEQSERMFRGLVEMSLTRYGEWDSRTAKALRHLGSLCLERERYTEAERWLRRALAIQRRLHGERHLQTIIAMNDLAIAEAELKRLTAAEELQRHALELAREVLGPHHPETFNNLNNLAMLLRDQQRYAAAEVLHRESLALHREVLGDDHRDTLVSRHNLARIQAYQGRTNEAILSLRDVLADRVRVLGARHPDSLVTLRALSAMLGEVGQFAEADRLGSETVECTRQIFGPTHPRVRAALEQMIRLHENWQRSDPAYSKSGAQEWRDRLASFDASRSATATE